MFIKPYKFGLFSQLRICKPSDPSPLRSGYLDIKDAQYATNKDGCKISYHILSRLGATGVQRYVLGTQKFKFLQ